MHIELRQSGFDPYRELDTYQAEHAARGSYGATAVFVGSMRDFNEGEPVKHMHLEHYPGMTEKHLQKICDDAGQRWALLDILLLHRVGDIEIGDSIVLVAVWSAHRGDALDACRFIIEDLKHKAPFWKKEALQSGDRWVERNTDGYAEKTSG